MIDYDPISTIEQKFQVSLKRVGRTDEYTGPCPLQCGGQGDDRFHVWADRGNYWCRQCQSSGFVDEFLDKPIEPIDIAKIAAERARLEREKLDKSIERAKKVSEELQETEKWLEYYENAGDRGRKLWELRGIPIEWQGFWELGFCSDFSLWRKDDVDQWVDWWHSPTLSIPIRDCSWGVKNIKHRLLDEPDNAGKYRYEKSGLPSLAFTCLPDKDSGPLFLAEGEIKSMVTCVTLDDDNLQVSGLPSVKPSGDILDSYKDYEPIYLCLDPDAYDDCEKLAKILGRERVRIIRLPMKIDDAIVAGALDKVGITRLMRTAI